MSDLWTLGDGRTIEFRSNDPELWEVWSTGIDPGKIGEFRFMHFDYPDGRGVRDCYLVTHMHLENSPDGTSYIGAGIGTEIIRQMSINYTVVFSPEDGIRRDDGSHLTGDGPGFARAMIKRRLASWDGPSEDDDYDD